MLLVHKSMLKPSRSIKMATFMLLAAVGRLDGDKRLEALLLRAFRPSGRSEKGCERLGHVDEASAGLANAGDWRTEAVDRGRAVGGLNAAVCRRGSRPTAHPRESCGD